VPTIVAGAALQLRPASPSFLIWRSRPSLDGVGLDDARLFASAAWLTSAAPVLVRSSMYDAPSKLLGLGLLVGGC
jgi:hypothetical protein